MKTRQIASLRLVVEAELCEWRQVPYRERKDLAQGTIRYPGSSDARQSQARRILSLFTTHTALASPPYTRVTGKVSYRAKDREKVVRKGQQIWVYYGEGVTIA